MISEDQKYGKEVIKELKQHFYDLEISILKSNSIKNDFNIIRSSKIAILGNSTFSWWASLLSDATQVWFNKEWQPNHYNGMIRLGETDYPNWKGIIPYSLKD